MLFCFVFFSACVQKDTVVERPNIVWITSEDNSKHYMKMFDEIGVETPNIERLATHGVKFTRAFSNAPVCSAARSTLISGCYGPRIASNYHRKIETVPMPESLAMFPAYLKAAGYYTSNNSKEDYNIIKSDSVWDDSSKKASWRNRKEGQPFFHVQNFTTTHESQLFFKEEELKAADTLTDRNTCFIQPNHPHTEIFKYLNARYRDKIVALDEQVGDVIDKLEKDGLLDNTFVFYYGDHGGVLPGSKGYLFETGLHVPLVVHIPKKYEHLVSLKPGTSSEAFVSFVDFGPTVLNLAGVDVPEAMDGKPFLGKGVTAEDMLEKNITYGYADRFDEKYDMVRSVRKGKYKYIRNYQPFNYDGLWNNYRYKQGGYVEWYEMYKKGELNEVQARFFETKLPEVLYDVEADPYETNNLADKPEYEETLKDMRFELNSWVKEMPDLSFYPEHVLINNAFSNPVAYGQQHKSDISGYVDVANLEIENFDVAKAEIEENLNSEDAWKRYWALIVCSSFGEKSKGMLPTIKQIAKNDSELINRLRAAEFLGLTQTEDPTDMICEILYQSEDAIEALLILNSVVMLQDGHGYNFDIELDKISTIVKEESQVQRRLEYLGVK